MNGRGYADALAKLGAEPFRMGDSGVDRLVFNDVVAAIGTATKFRSVRRAQIIWHRERHSNRRRMPLK